MILLESLGELEVDTDPAVLPAIGWAGARADGDDILVESDVEDGTRRVDIDKGVPGGAARADGGNVPNLYIADSGRGGHELIRGEGGGNANE